MKDLLRANETTNKTLENVHAYMREGEFEIALKNIESLLGVEFENVDVLSITKCLNFWVERKIKLNELNTDYEKAAYLFKEYKHFLTFLDKIKYSSKSNLYPIKEWLFLNALKNLTNLAKDDENNDSDIFFKLGYCYKALGDYDKALLFYEKANRIIKDDPEIISELADTYALVNETKIAKIFFKEAFYINPQKIDIFSFESLLIKRIIDKLKEDGFSSPTLEEWVPIYGVLLGVFNVSRELKPIELGKLKQSIFSFENDLSNSRDKEYWFIPRLINKYFWLIDHYRNSKEDKSKINEILNKIKALDNATYEKYIN